MTVGHIGRRSPREIVIHTTDRGGIVAPTRLRRMMTPTLHISAEYRREVTRNDPFLFGLIYLPHHLSVETEAYDLISPSEWHMEAFARMRGWMVGGPQRHATFAPRKGGKTTVYYVVGLLWAIAHGHARFALAFAHNAGQTEGHLAKIAAELVANPYHLIEDFPELRPVKSSARDIITAGGAQISARGMDAGALGISSQANDRPDLILLDDIEPDAEHYSMGGKGKRLGTLLNAILPMNEDAIVEWTGTVTMYGSMAHDLVLLADGERVADWVRETGFTADHYPAILDEGKPTERSLWPVAWSLEKLRKMKYPRWPDRKRVSRSFALNYDNRPESAGGLYWTRDLIRVTPQARSVRYVLAIDTAVTNGPNSDMTALCLMGQSADGRHLTVEWAWAGRITGARLREIVHQMVSVNSSVRDVLIEGNQGGDRWLEILNPEGARMPGGMNVPGGVTVTVTRPDKRGSKRNRLEWLLAQYELGLIGHRHDYPELVDQMLAWPKTPHDDLLDAVEAAAAYFAGRPDW